MIDFGGCLCGDGFHCLSLGNCSDGVVGGLAGGVRLLLAFKVVGCEKRAWAFELFQPTASFSFSAFSANCIASSRSWMSPSIKAGRLYMV